MSKDSPLPIGVSLQEELIFFRKFRKAIVYALWRLGI